MQSHRLCAPLLIASALATSALTAAGLAQTLTNELNLVTGKDVFFSKTDAGELEVIIPEVRTLDDLKQKLQSVEIDAKDDDPRFFQPVTDNGGTYYSAVVTHRLVKEMANQKGVPVGKIPSQAAWQKIANGLVQKASIADTQSRSGTAGDTRKRAAAA